jgi:hypothetical protein
MTYIVGYEFMKLLFTLLSFEGNTHYFVSLPNINVDRKVNRSKCVARDKPHILTVQLIKEARGKSDS